MNKMVVPFIEPAVVEVASTPAQIEMWLSEKSAAGAGLAYNEAFSIRLRGAVDDGALLRALRHLPEIHESLRGRFSPDGLRFILAPSIELPIARHDLTGLPESERTAALGRIAHADSSTPYPLETGPLVRAAIVRVDAQTVVVILSVHHAASDGWSLDLLLADLARLYTAFATNTDLPAPPQHGFSDYVRFCAQPTIVERIQKSRDYWRTVLDRPPSPLTLASDGKRPPFRTFGSNHDGFSLDAGELARLKAFARANGISLFTVLLAGYATLLHRLSGAKDLIVGIPVAGHTESDMEDCVGHLVNLVPIRFDFSGTPRFRDLCQATNNRVIEAVDHAWVSFGELVKDLKIPRDPARVPLVPVMFTHVQKYAPGKIAFGSCEVDYRLNPRTCETFEVSLNAVESHEGLSFHAHANADLYSPTWLRWRLRELATLLVHGCAEPDTTVDRLPLLSPDESAWIRQACEVGGPDYPKAAGLATLFEAKADEHPDAVAVRFGSAVVTYGDLEARANRLAHALRQRGVARGHRVGICVDRSPDMLVAMLAVLKAGAGYVPLDPGFPAERLAYMVEDARLTLVVSQSHLAARHGCEPLRTLALDAESAALAGLSDGRLPTEGAAGGDDLAYVLYTSGSTGKPKGVCVPHRAVVNFLGSMAREPGLAAGDRVLAITTLSFDIAVLELLLPLSVGAQIVLATRDQAMDPDALRRLVEDEGVTLMQATPSTWRLLLASGWAGSTALRALCGGEAMPLDLSQALMGKVGALWNMYGPTETTVWSTCGRITDPEKGVTIGRPIAHTTIRIVDEHRGLCPVGVPGEICIGGDGVALGYWQRPDLTADRFVSDPHDARPGARMYRTGDLGRLRADGELECLGRLDFQVKIRGYRIELGEIENVLATHPSVDQAVVAAREDQPGDVRLVAYIIPRGTGIPEGELRTHLRRSVPDYMVPQHFVTVGAFPTTPNGKVDRKALPAPDFVAAPVAAARAARAGTEEDLLALWKALLKQESIGVGDNFFDVGGHSLLGVTLIAEIKKRMGVPLPLSQILHTPTVESLAAVIDGLVPKASEKSAASQNVVEIRPGDGAPLFFIYDGFGEVMPYFNLARRLPRRYSVYGVLPRRLPRIPLAHTSVEDMARFCATEIRRVQPNGPYTLAGLCAGGVVAFAVAEHLESQGHTVAHILLLDAIDPSTKLRPFRTTRKRWKRFTSALRPAPHATDTVVPFPVAVAAAASASPSSKGDIVGKVLGKAKGLLAYEASHLAESATVAARFQLLRWVLGQGQDWPEWMPSLTVQQIYDCVRGQYRPGRVHAPVILVRAGEGEGADEPAIELAVDPLLGWGERAGGGVQVIDASGGHSSMLQEPRVDTLAKHIVAALAGPDETVDQAVGA